MVAATSSSMAVDSFGFTFDPLLSRELIVLGKYIVAISFAQLIAMACAPRGDRLSSGNLLLWLPVAPLLCSYATKEVLTNYFGALEIRTLSFTPEGLTAIRAYVALQTVGTVVELLQMVQRKRSEWVCQFPIIAHHVISVVSCVMTLHCRRAIASVSCVVLVEYSTIFLNFLLLAKHKTYKPWVEKHMPWLKILSGIGLWAAFIAFRILLLPYILVRWFSDHASRHSVMKDFTYFEIIYHTCVALILWVLSLIWFQKIHKGFMKTVFPSKCDESEKSSKKK